MGRPCEKPRRAVCTKYKDDESHRKQHKSIKLNRTTADSAKASASTLHKVLKACKPLKTTESVSLHRAAADSAKGLREQCAQSPYLMKSLKTPKFHQTSRNRRRLCERPRR